MNNPAKDNILSIYAIDFHHKRRLESKKCKKISVLRKFLNIKQYKCLKMNKQQPKQDKISTVFNKSNEHLFVKSWDRYYLCRFTK